MRKRSQLVARKESVEPLVRTKGASVHILLRGFLPRRVSVNGGATSLSSSAIRQRGTAKQRYAVVRRRRRGIAWGDEHRLRTGRGKRIWEREKGH